MFTLPPLSKEDRIRSRPYSLIIALLTLAALLSTGIAQASPRTQRGGAPIRLRDATWT